MTDEPQYNFPDTVAECADRYAQLRAQRLALQKQVDALRSEGYALEQHIIETLRSQKAEGTVGREAVARIKDKRVPKITDSQAFQNYIVEHEAWHLANRLQPSASGLKEVIDGGQAVPGVEIISLPALSVTKA